MIDELEEFVSMVGSAVLPRTRGEGAVPTIEKRAEVASQDSTQWAVLGNESYVATGQTVAQLPPAVYKLSAMDGRVFFQVMHLAFDELLRMPDAATGRVLDSITQFWQAENSFKANGQLFKRGILLYGPAGSGKSATVVLLAQDLIQRGGIVIYAFSPGLTAEALSIVRRIEPQRPIICILEDMDDMVDRFGEAELLSLLDGEQQVGNICFIATTNYPERLDPRFVNRPSRFDEIIKVGMPSRAAREVYFRARVKTDQLNGSLEHWLDDTEGFSLAHMRELVVSVFCLGRTYEETIKRLTIMRRLPASSREREVGFASGRSD